MVDDPSANPDLFPTERAQEIERERLFRIVEALVKWENTTNEGVLQAARDEIWQSWRRTCVDNIGHPRAKEIFNRYKLPAFHDPFAGGGALPLEAQRLGLESHASDLNPVAVLINKAMIEIPPKFTGRAPVNPECRTDQSLIHKYWHGVDGLAMDIRHYGRWMRDEAENRIGHLYPKMEISEEVSKDRQDLKAYLGQQLTVIAWLWARTVKSPNPAFADVDVPLASTFMLSTKSGKEVYVEPIVEQTSYRFAVRLGKPPNEEIPKNGTKLSRGAFRCLMSGSPFPYTYIDDEANAGRMGSRLMAIVAEGVRGRVYLSPTEEMERIARTAQPTWKPDAPSRGTWASNAQGRQYGFRTFGDYFTPRQLVALTTFSDLVLEAREKIKEDALTSGLSDDSRSLDAGGGGATAYADAVAIYLAFAVSKLANIGSSIASWMSDRGAFRETFARQGIPMVWDFVEANTFADAGGSFLTAIEKGAMAVEFFPCTSAGFAVQADAASQTISTDKIVSTDPPYYDNIGYADLSDFFYVWLRRSLKTVFPTLFGTLAVPKTEELVATTYRHGSKEEAESFFLQGMTRAMHCLAERTHPGFPVTVYYAFKQAEDEDNQGTASTGWETFLDAVIRAGFAVTGTWPMRTEGAGRIVATGTNALASSIILVCQPRPAGVATATRRDFLGQLKAELPSALKHLQRGNIAPVDLAQAAIGPGMGIYSTYSKILDASGQPLSVREGLSLINQVLDEALTEQEGDFDPQTRWALAWFDQSGFGDGDYGVAETLSKAKNTSLKSMADSGVLAQGRGKVRLVKPSDLPKEWQPREGDHPTIWETVHHLVRALESGGEASAAALVIRLGPRSETARELAYRLYTVCERKKRPQEALSYNALVQSWPEILRIARESTVVSERQTQSRMFDRE
jgi:putative DNA methylase